MALRTIDQSALPDWPRIPTKSPGAILNSGAQRLWPRRGAGQEARSNPGEKCGLGLSSSFCEPVRSSPPGHGLILVLEGVGVAISLPTSPTTPARRGLAPVLKVDNTMSYDLKERISTCQPKAHGRHKDRPYGSTPRFRTKRCSGRLQNLHGLPSKSVCFAGDFAWPRTPASRSRYYPNTLTNARVFICGKASGEAAHDS